MRTTQQLLAELAEHPDAIAEISPREFEEVIAELLAGSGYEVQLTHATRDGGFDIMAVHKAPLGLETTSVIECKRYSGNNKVSVAQLRALYGVKAILGVSNAILVTTSTFTADARHFAASRYDMQLVDHGVLVQWLANYKPTPAGGLYITSRRFYSCFISHSHKDGQFAETLNDAMRAAGVRVWFAPEDMRPGKKLFDQIESAIMSFDKLLVVLSENSMKSDWVATEIHNARKREREEDRQILFPIALAPMEDIRKWKCFDADSGKDLAVELREYFIPDFSDWHNEKKFRVQLAKLLEGLTSGGSYKSADGGGGAWGTW